MRNASSAFLKDLISRDPGFLLLRQRSAPFILSFLHREFKAHHNQILKNSEAVDDLILFLKKHEQESEGLDEFLDDEEETQSDLKSRADFLLKKWCSDKYAFLSREITREGVPILQLSAGVERLFTWLEATTPKEFVGTSSRFVSILDAIKKLKFNITESPEERISSLLKDRAKIDEEIRRIKATNRVDHFSPEEALDALEFVRNSAIELMADFKTIEDNFRKISKDIYKKHSEENATKGSVVGYILDAERELRMSPQGQSFENFWNFISVDISDEIGNNLDEILNYLEEKGEAYPRDFLPHLKRFLYERGKKIIEGNRMLSEKISRVLAFENSEEKLAVSKNIAEIKTLVSSLENDENFDMNLLSTITMEVEDKPSLLKNYTLRMVEEERKYKALNTEKVDENIPLDFLYNPFFVDEEALKNKVRSYKKSVQSQFSLGELVKKFPITQGLAEVVVWMKIAEVKTHKGFRVEFIKNETEILFFEKDGAMKKITMPKVVFL